MRARIERRVARHGGWQFIAMAALLVSGVLHAQQTVSFPTTDGALIYADEYGPGACGVVLAHDGRLNRASWQEQAQTLVAASSTTPLRSTTAGASYC